MLDWAMMNDLCLDDTWIKSNTGWGADRLMRQGFELHTTAFQVNLTCGVVDMTGVTDAK